MTLKQYKKTRRQIAIQLGYCRVMENIVDMIDDATSEIAVDRIMIDARRKMEKREVMIRCLAI